MNNDTIGYIKGVLHGVEGSLKETREELSKLREKLETSKVNIAELKSELKTELRFLNMFWGAVGAIAGTITTFAVVHLLTKFFTS